MFKLIFTTDNVAFKDGTEYNNQERNETSRILREIARRIDQKIIAGPVMDIDGNKIGEYRLRSMSIGRKD